MIESILKCRVFNRYGGSEISLIAHEDNIEKNKLKIMNFRLYLESKNKKLIVTDFTNRAIPFIRYELGDLAEKNNWKYIEYVEGRSNLEFKISNKEYLNSIFSIRYIEILAIFIISWLYKKRVKNLRL